MSRTSRAAIGYHSTLGAPYYAGDGQITLAVGGGGIWQGVTPSVPGYLLVISNEPHPRSDPIQAVYACTGIANNILSGVTLVEGTDQYFPAGSAAWLCTTTVPIATAPASIVWAWGVGLGAPVSVANDLGLWEIASAAGSFTRIDLVAKTGPVGAALILDVKKSSDHGVTFTSLWASTPSNRPTIADGAVFGTQSSFDSTTFAAADVLRLDVIQVGSTTPGTNITARLLGTYA